MNNVAKYALVPLLITQAHWVRRRAPVLPEAEGPRDGLALPGPGGHGPASDAAVGQPSTASAREHEPPLRLLLLGDSSAAGVGVATQSQALIGHLVRSLTHLSARAVRWRVIAKSGASSLEALALLEAAPDEPADVAVVALGVNDLVEQVPMARALRTRGMLLRRLRRKLGVQHTVFAPVPPVHQFPLLPNPLRSYAGSQARLLDASVARWAARQRAASHVPIDLQLSREVMAIDGYHPGEVVYRICGEALAAHLCAKVLPALQWQASVDAISGQTS